MKKLFYCLLLVSVSLCMQPAAAFAQRDITLLVNVTETLQFLKDIKTNKASLEKAVGEIKTKYAGKDSVISTFRQKYTFIKLAADNILNTLVIDLMDKQKRKIFVDRPSLITEYYDEQVSVYNQSVKDFNMSYSKLKGDKNLISFLREAGKLLVGELLNVTRRIAIEILIEKIRAPYQMKDWKDI